MIYSKSNPVYEDAWIHRLLVSMEKDLLSAWSVATGTCKFFGRCEKVINNEVEKEVFYSSGKYIDVYTDDKMNFTSYVSINGEMRYENKLRKLPAQLVCQANLQVLYPSIAHRADAELRQAIERVLLKHVEPIDYRGFTIIDQNEYVNMQPFHTVKFNFDISV